MRQHNTLISCKIYQKISKSSFFKIYNLAGNTAVIPWYKSRTGTLTPIGITAIFGNTAHP